MSDVMYGVFDSLQSDGYFYDPLVMEVKSDFLPWLRTAFERKWSRIVTSRNIADRLIEGALNLGRHLGDKEDEERIQRENEEKARLEVGSVRSSRHAKTNYAGLLFF